MMKLCATPMPEQMNPTCIRGMLFLGCNDSGRCCCAGKLLPDTHGAGGPGVPALCKDC